MKIMHLLDLLIIYILSGSITDETIFGLTSSIINLQMKII